MGKQVGIMYSALQNSLQTRVNIIEESIKSIKNQTYQDWICAICVEQGRHSLDNEIMKAIGDDSRFIFLPGMQESNYGNCRNASFSLLGDVDYITALDSTDYYKPDHIAKRVNLFEKNPGLDYTYGMMDIVGDEWVIDMYDKTRKILILEETSQGPTIFVKRTIFEKFGGYKNIYGADGELLQRMEDNKKITILKLKDEIYKTYVAIKR